jgi:hypothetical protein
MKPFLGFRESHSTRDVPKIKKNTQNTDTVFITRELQVVTLVEKWHHFLRNYQFVPRYTSALKPLVKIIVKYL